MPSPVSARDTDSAHGDPLVVFSEACHSLHVLAADSTCWLTSHHEVQPLSKAVRVEVRVPLGVSDLERGRYR